MLASLAFGVSSSLVAFILWASINRLFQSGIEITSIGTMTNDYQLYFQLDSAYGGSIDDLTLTINGSAELIASMSSSAVRAVTSNVSGRLAPSATSE